MTLQLMKIDGKNPEGEPLHYTACGLDDVYLVNGFTRETIDGEQFTTIENMDILWKAIARHLVTKKKVLAPKEIKYLRGQMDLTQAELAHLVRVSDQTIARWEKGETSIQGPADFMVRVLYLASPRAQPEGQKVLDKLLEVIERVVASDEQPKKPVVFIHRMKSWKETAYEPCEMAYA
jgi:DNA-binding transcriptional regulator YiaG